MVHWHNYACQLCGKNSQPIEGRAGERHLLMRIIVRYSPTDSMDFSDMTLTQIKRQEMDSQVKWASNREGRMLGQLEKRQDDSIGRGQKRAWCYEK